MDFIIQLVLKLLDFLRSYVDWWGRAVSALSREFDLGIPPDVCAFLGLGVGMLILFSFFRVLFKWDQKGNKPQPFPLKTTETPNEVVAKDFEKLLMMLLKVALFVLLAAAVVSSR